MHGDDNTVTTISLSQTDVVNYLHDNKESYFATFTLKPKLYKYTSITQLELTNNELFSVLHQCSENFICVAEHTKAGNVHYHAIITFRDNLQRLFLCNRIKKQRLFGFMKLDAEPISNIQGVANYMTKDLYTTCKIFTSTPGRRPRYTMTNQQWHNNYAI